MPREVTDGDGIAWTCIQAFAGLGKDREKTDAARVDGAENLVHVVCTPSGGAKSIRLQLPDTWEEGLDDDALAKAIGSASDE
jgi:hypothetical protein